MAYITTRASHNTQPQLGRVAINPEFAMPAEVFIPHIARNGVLWQTPATTEATFTVKSGGAALGINVSATGRRYTRTFFQSQAIYAWLVVAYRDSSATSTYSVVRCNGSLIPVQEANNTVRVGFWPGGVLRLWDYTIAPISQYQARVNTFSGRVDASTATLGVNGSTATTSPDGSVPGTLSTTSNPMCIGATEGGAEIATPWTIVMVVFWERTIPTHQQLLSLNASPWKLFIPARSHRAYFIPPPPASPATLRTLTTGMIWR